MKDQKISKQNQQSNQTDESRYGAPSTKYATNRWEYTFQADKNITGKYTPSNIDI